MKIGTFASITTPEASPATILDMGRRAEAAGLDSLWMGEHVVLFDEMEFPYPGSPDGRLPIPHGSGLPDTVVTLSYLAGVTEELRLGTGVSLIPQRNPIYTANEFATLDYLTNGRVDLGVGVGWCKEVVLACGYEWETRGERCDEILELMIKLWTEPVTTHHGKHFRVDDCRMDPKPVQKPHVPLIVGGYSPAAIKRYARTQHSITNTAIEFAGDEARVETYVTAYHYLEVDGDQGTEMTYLGRYMDRMQKRGDVWKIIHRQVVMDWNQNVDTTAVWEGPTFSGLARGARAPDDPVNAMLG